MPPDSNTLPRPQSTGQRTPPEWRSERFFKKLNLLPAAAKRVLDSLAKLPVLKFFFIPFTSVWLGITLIFLIGVYVGIGSAFANLRAWMEMTDLEFFDAWPMRILIALLALNLTIVTIRRIPLTLYKAGVWTVHIGILTLLTGCVWYFSQKTEGSVRIFLNQSVGEFYDVTERALYAYTIKPDGTPDLPHGTMTPLPGMPIYNEYFRENHNPLKLRVPQSALTGLNPALSNVSLRVVGYYPYASLENHWEPDPNIDEDDPTSANLPKGKHAVHIGFTASGLTEAKYFLAAIPAERIYDGPDKPFTLEYLLNPTPEQLADINADVPASLGVTVRIPKLNFTKTFPITDDKPFPVEGTPYTLAAGDQNPMPLASKGYENTFSNNLTFHITRKNPDGTLFNFDRMQLSHFPEISPDFITIDGKPKRIQEQVDHDIQLTFHDNQRDQFWVVENSAAPADQKFTLYHRKTGGGKTTSTPVKFNQPVDFTISGIPIKLSVLGETDHAIEVTHPVIVPPEQRDRGQTAMDAMQYSIAELSLSRGTLQDRRFYVPFVQFAQVGPAPIGREPTIVNLPGVGPDGRSVKIGFILSTTRRELPNTIKLIDFKAVKYPGANRAFQDYISTMEVTEKSTGKTATLTAQLNNPAECDGNYYFQSSWDGDKIPGVRFSVLGIGNRPGLHVMIIGAFLIFIGIGYAFYIKPLLLNAKKKSLAQWAAKKPEPTL